MLLVHFMAMYMPGPFCTHPDHNKILHFIHKSSPGFHIYSKIWSSRLVFISDQNFPDGSYAPALNRPLDKGTFDSGQQIVR